MNNDCGHQCYIIGGPFIAEDPNCPVHRRKPVRVARPEPCSRCGSLVPDWQHRELLLKDTVLARAGKDYLGDAVILCEKCEMTLTDWWKEFWNV